MFKHMFYSLLLLIMFSYYSNAQSAALYENNFGDNLGINIENDIISSGTDIDTELTGTDSQREEIGDTVKVSNKIESVREANGKFFVKVQLKEDNTPIELNMFNMLGKMVVRIYKGKAKNGQVFEFDAELQNGIYICLMNGPNIRDAEKIIISR